MKRNHIYRYSVLTILLTIVMFIACQKQLNKTNPSYPTLDTYFRNSDELQKGTNAIYSIFHSAQLIAREWFFLHDLRSDDVTAGGSQLELPRRQILEGNITPDNTVMNDVWKGAYTVIHRANTVIFFSSQVTDNTSLRDRCVAEAKFFRGWAYFELVSLWGAVPMYLQPVTEASQFQSRATADAVYAQIIKDLEEAAAVLPPVYDAADRGRATSGAANAMLGRVQMQKGDYGAARTALLKVKNSNQYSLVANYLDNFLEETEFNPESIFEAVFFETAPNQFNWGYTGDDPSQPQGTVRNQEYSPIAWRNLVPSNRYLEEFEYTSQGHAKTDPRYKMSVYESGDTYNNGNSVLTDADQNNAISTVYGVNKKVSWRKFMLIYKHGKGGDRAGGGINQRIIRYAEVLLMLAECENELNNPGAAIDYLNEVRDRPSVMMPHYPTTQYPVGNKAQIQQAIMHEKTVELGGEEIRNRDILRWRKKGYFTTEPISYFRPNRDELLPIPQQEIDNNPQLAAGGINKQNGGY
ncbi:RagB/SusD family nutrient uptake outer membrane protein [Niastella populi]|uniref:Carbohydrate-binding protein SusD n=1 Tax=Niastella populi TaxID=550983 RepID=A0A1V9G4R2_9BACT|nr:RagB/SusD family nutrient uptake outer membrane protein [Niastella populi]OQP65577.1 carbohydrate-binding protein SusD [Niastella populi]